MAGSNKCRLAACYALSATSFDSTAHWFILVSKPKEVTPKHRQNGVDPDGNQSWGEAISFALYVYLKKNKTKTTATTNWRNVSTKLCSPLTCGLCLCRFRCWTWWVANVSRPRNGDTSVTFNCFIHLFGKLALLGRALAETGSTDQTTVRPAE